ncbi:ATP-grasp domain-containing protein [Paramagnetospirillum magneticum]|nr:hypothetical protein [Paramagnetospirillum magneticum]
MARLTTMAFHGENMVPPAIELLKRSEADSTDSAALLDLATIHFLLGHEDAGQAYQDRALAQDQVYRDHSDSATEDGVKLLAFAAPGNLMSNVPIQFLIEGSEIQLDVLYVVPGMDLPERVPAHDMAMVIAGESDPNREILERIAAFADLWPCPPVLNDPRKVLQLSRDGVSTLLAGAKGIRIPATTRIDPETLARLGRGEVTLTELLPDGTFPIIARPLDSHAGKGLAKLDAPSSIALYLAAQPAEGYYLSSFVDYRGADGLFRKYRIAMIDGKPFVCHMAVSSHWMIHYLNADMRESAEKRAEEARAFASFDEDFAARHAEAFAAMAERIGLDYFAMDCAETPDGELLVFEADTAMIVHAMDPPEIFPYKAPQMRRIFQAFQDMLRRIKRAKQD